MAKHPAPKADPKPAEHTYGTPVPPGVQPRIQKFDDGKSISDVGLPNTIVSALTAENIVNVGRLRRVRDIDLDVDSTSLLLLREKVPFEVRPDEKVLVPDEDHPGDWVETDSRDNRSSLVRRGRASFPSSSRITCLRISPTSLPTGCRSARAPPTRSASTASLRSSSDRVPTRRWSPWARTPRRRTRSCSNSARRSSPSASSRAPPKMLSRVEPARLVRFAVPAYAGLSSDTKRSIIEGAKALVAAGIEIEDADTVGGCCYVDYARNQLVARFLRGRATDLVFIDADVGFEPEALLRLCQATRPLIAGIYPKKIDPPEWPVALDAPEVWSDVDGLVECSMLPTGFMRIHRSVFEAMDMVPHYAVPDHGQVGAYFQCVVRDGQYLGEDVEFCRRYRDLGGHLYAFVDMDFRHVGSAKTFHGNWSHWLREQMKEAA